jgi:hypothetical protein
MNSPRLALLFGTLLLFRAPRLFAQPSPAAIAAFNTYAAQLESRLAQQHRSPATFVTLTADSPRSETSKPKDGEPLIENLTPAAQPSDALIHHWRATAFIPSATPADFERLLRNFSAYPQNFAPDIVSSTVLTHTPTDTLLRLRTRQHHVITVVLDTICDVTFAALDPSHGYSISRSTRIDEITSAGAASTDKPDHGFLYRLNTYWSWEQRDNGLYIQLESLSLTRSIPRGLAWAVRPYLESIPRDSLIFTLTSARNALTTTTNH